MAVKGANKYAVGSNSGHSYSDSLGGLTIPGATQRAHAVLSSTRLQIA